MEFSQRLQIFDKRPPFVAGQCRTDDAGRQLRYISLLALERVSAIAVAEKRYVEICQASRVRILVVGFRDNATLTGSNSRLPIQKDAGRSSWGNSMSRSVGMEPLCR